MTGNSSKAYTRSADRNSFVDIQVNGYGGVEFSAPGLTVDDVRKVTFELRARGTIAYCPTVVTSADEIFRASLGVLSEAMRDADLSGHILGIHLEGPFISPEVGARGFHSVEHILPPSVEKFKRYQDWADGKISILTLAPEQPGAEELTRHASGLGVVVALGHHNADAESLKAAVDAGARCVTHLGNGIPDSVHRHRNPMWWQLASDALCVSLITDGNHLPPELVKVALRAKGVDRSIVISDGTSLSGMPPGSYERTGQKVVLEESGRISIPGTPYLAGSSATMLDCMNFLASLDLLTEEELRKVGFENPLKLLGKSAEFLRENGVDPTRIVAT